MQSTSVPLKILLAKPRGFCAGVDRAIQIVEQALKQFGPPVYVRHEIVHNEHVVNRLRNMGAVFVDELDEVPSEYPVIFSAHGVPKSVPEAAKNRKMLYVDATCPLVSKVHHEAEHLYEKELPIVLIGHAGHPEVIGTMGQLPKGAIYLVETLDDIPVLPIDRHQALGVITQTTLSVDDTAELLEALRKRFSNLIAPKKEDICYATTNRQQAVKHLAERADCIWVVGSPNSSNARRLVEVAQKTRPILSQLITNAEQIPWSLFKEHSIKILGLTAGASTPEDLVEAIIFALGKRYNITIEEINVTDENVHFKLPKILQPSKNTSNPCMTAA